MSDFATSYAEITKSEVQADGSLMVYGKATDDSLDIDNQICDAVWLDKAMPEWFKTGGNIREQHSNIAAGVAKEYESKADGHYISAHVVDPVSVKKVEAGVLKGFSIGIKSPRVVRDQKAANGRIIDGQIVEVSLVDRPANPNAKLILAKSVDGESSLVQVEEIVKYNEEQERDDHGRFGSGGGSSGGDSKITDAKGRLFGSVDVGRFYKEVGKNITNLKTYVANAKADPKFENEQGVSAKEVEDKVNEALPHLTNAFSYISDSNTSSNRLGLLSRAEDQLNEATSILGSGPTSALENYSFAIDAIAQDVMMHYTNADKSTDPDLAKGSPDQERDDHGRWTSGDGGMDASRLGIPSNLEPRIVAHRSISSVGPNERATNETRARIDEVHRQPVGPEAKTTMEEIGNKLEGIKGVVKNNLEGAFFVDQGVDAVRGINEAQGFIKDASNAENVKDSKGFLWQAHDSLEASVASLRDSSKPADHVAAAGLDGFRTEVVHLMMGMGGGEIKSTDANLSKGSPDQERDDHGRWSSGGGEVDSADAHGHEDPFKAQNQITSGQVSVLKEHESAIRDIRQGLENNPHDDPIRDMARAKLMTAENIINEASRKISDKNEAASAALRAAAPMQSAMNMLEEQNYHDEVAAIHEQRVSLISSVTGIKNDVIKSASANITDLKLNKQEFKVQTIKTIMGLYNKSLTGDIVKFDQKAYDAARSALAKLIIVEAQEMAAGDDETSDIDSLLSALKHLFSWYDGEVEGGEVEGVISTESEVVPDTLEMAAEPDACGCKCGKCADGKGCDADICKCDKMAKSAEGDEPEVETVVEATEILDESVIAEIVEKAVKSATESVKAEIAELQTATKAAEAKVVALESDLVTAKAAAASGGPKRTGHISVTKDNETLLKAAQFDAKAAATSDPVLARGYRALAKEFTAKAGLPTQD